MPDQTTGAHRVVVAGGGIAGLEAVCALHGLAADRLHVTLLEPRAEFEVRALSVNEPFAAAGSRRYPVEELCADHGARRVGARAAEVLPGERIVRTETGERLPYDSLLVAVGATARPAYPRALTFRGGQDSERVHGLVQDLEGGYVTSFAFVVPPAQTWPLPLYELALMTAERARSLSLDDVSATLVTPEDAPLAIFGASASDAVAEAAREVGLELVTGATVTAVEPGVVRMLPGGRELAADRVVALPTLLGTALPGLPADADGFLPVDEVGHVRGVPDVFAAGDGTSFPIKQGGIGAQQADAAAAEIARRAGADVEPRPFRPTLRAKLLTGSRARYLRQAVAGGAGEQASTASQEALWWPPSKVAAPFLAPYLERIDRGERGAATTSLAEQLG